MDDEHLPHLNYTLPTQSISNNNNFSQTYRPTSQQPQQIPNRKKFSQTVNLAPYQSKNGKFYNPSGFGLSNVRLRPLKEAENKFQIAIRNYCEACKIDEDMQLMRARSAFTQSFNNFVQYSTVVFNSQHPTDDSHILLPRSAVMITARRLIVDWARFIKKLNEITVQNTPIQNSSNNDQSSAKPKIKTTGETIPAVFPQLLKAIDDLNVNLSIVLEYYYVGSISSRISGKQMKAIDDRLAEIRKIVLSQIYSSKSQSNVNQKKMLVSSSDASAPNNDKQHSTNSMMGSTGFTVNTFAEKCFDVVNRIQAIFLSEMPCQRSQAGSIILDKINLTVALNAFADLVKALYNFHTYDEAARAAVIEMNDELTNTFKQLGLPFELKLVHKTSNSENSGEENNTNNNNNASNEGAMDINIGISSKVSEKDALMYFTEINSQISSQYPESNNQSNLTSNPKEKKVQSPGKGTNNRSPRKITRK